MTEREEASLNRIASFTVDHDRLEPGIYVSRRDGDVTTYDLRTRKPNAGDYMDNRTMHSVEHMFATFVRNSEIRDSVIYFGPMGCQTGFYFLFDSAQLTDAQRQNLVMTRNFIAQGTSTYSITGGQNTNLVHAGWAGVNCPTQRLALTPNLYNSLTIEQIETVLKDSANPSNNTVYFIVNEHDGLRNSKDLDVGVPGWAEALKNRPETIHYLGMAREGGNSPFYIVEMAFYQNILYPDLDTGLDYREMMDYFIRNFTDETENYEKYFEIGNFFKDFGVI